MKFLNSRILFSFLLIILLAPVGCTGLKSQNERLKEEITDIKLENDKLRKELNSLRTENSNIHIRLAQLNFQSSSLYTEIQNLKKDIETFKAQAKEARKRN